MQLEISREALLRPLQLVSGALGGRPTLPILGNVLLDVSNGLLSLTGTDLGGEADGPEVRSVIDRHLETEIGAALVAAASS